MLDKGNLICSAENKFNSKKWYVAISLIYIFAGFALLLNIDIFNTVFGSFFTAILFIVFESKGVFELAYNILKKECKIYVYDNYVTGVAVSPTEYSLFYILNVEKLETVDFILPYSSICNVDIINGKIVIYTRYRKYELPVNYNKECIRNEIFNKIRGCNI